MAHPPLRIGILGTAKIARLFVEGLAGTSAVRVDAVASRSAEAAQAFAAEFAIPRAVAGYDALLADRELDAIYIPLPNSLHAPWCERALRAGLHVLCEKPLTLTLAEARRLFDVARETGRVLLEAYPYRYQPQMQALRQLVGEGAIGGVRLVQASIGFTISQSPNIRLDPELGGGAMLDAGCYAVSFARLAVGRRPLEVSAQARWAGTGVDIGMTGTIRYDGGAQAQVACAMDAAQHRVALVVGTQGVIETGFLNHTAAERPGILHVRRGLTSDHPIETLRFEDGNGFRLEAEHFAQRVRSGTVHDDDDRQSLENMATLEALVRSAREGRAVAVEDTGADGR